MIIKMCLKMEGSPDLKIQVKYPQSGFLNRSHETIRKSEGFGASGSFPLVPTYKSGWVQIVWNMNDKRTMLQVVRVFLYNSYLLVCKNPGKLRVPCSYIWNSPFWSALKPISMWTILKSIPMKVHIFAKEVVCKKIRNDQF